MEPIKAKYIPSAALLEEITARIEQKAGEAAS